MDSYVSSKGCAKYQELERRATVWSASSDPCQLDKASSVVVASAGFVGISSYTGRSSYKYDLDDLDKIVAPQEKI
jgi:hypothetical protein